MQQVENELKALRFINTSKKCLPAAKTLETALV